MTEPDPILSCPLCNYSSYQATGGNAYSCRFCSYIFLDPLGIEDELENKDILRNSILVSFLGTIKNRREYPPKSKEELYNDKL